MRSQVLAMLLVPLAVTGAVAGDVGVNVNDVAVPASAVTASLASLTVPVASATTQEAKIVRTSDSAAMRRELIATVRGNGSEEQRLGALSQLWDQDDIFYLFFKPGKDHDVAVRVAAVERLAEIDILKSIGSKTGMPEVSKAISRRLKDTYADSRDREAPACSSAIARRYAQAMKSRSP